eukprot:1159208-Pelagomonas_calceolata.AAC.6
MKTGTSPARNCPGQPTLYCKAGPGQPTLYCKAGPGQPTLYCKAGPGQPTCHKTPPLPPQGIEHANPRFGLQSCKAGCPPCRAAHPQPPTVGSAAALPAWYAPPRSSPADAPARTHVPPSSRQTTSSLQALLLPATGNHFLTYT